MDHDPLFPHHKQIFEAVLKCLMEENEEIQDAAFSALKNVVSYLDITFINLSFLLLFEITFVFVLSRTVDIPQLMFCS